MELCGVFTHSFNLNLHVQKVASDRFTLSEVSGVPDYNPASAETEGLKVDTALVSWCLRGL